MKIDILNFDKKELEAFLDGHGEPRYRAGQLFTWLHRGVPFSEMSNLPKGTREMLLRECFINLPKTKRRLVSAIDGTIKYLFELSDGNTVESVVMKYGYGSTVCISSQVGCAMGCAFCASTIGGFIRNLEPSELLGQVIAAEADTGGEVSGIVMMGIGEPLNNFDNVVKFLRLVGAPGGLNIGYRHISLSTCGIVPNIYALSELDFPITLSVSLHAADDGERSALMPVNRRWGTDELLCACRKYFDRTGRRISFEYALIEGKNNTEAEALRLAALLHKYFPTGVPLHVNLIPVNEIAERDFKKSLRVNTEKFKGTLERCKINATVRRRLGSDINASCGQLRREDRNLGTNV